MSDVVTIEITDIGTGGDGVGHLGSDAIFVPYTMRGDKVTVKLGKKGRFGYQASLLSLDTASADRATPPCPHFTKCGGCQLQHLSADAYGEWITATVKNIFEHHGLGAVEIKQPIISPPKSRRRVNLKALKIKNDIVLGYMKRGSHQIVAIDACEIARSELTDLFIPLKAILKDILPDRMRADIHMTVTASGVDVLIDAPMSLSLEQREALVTFAKTQDLATVNWQEQGFLDPVIHAREAVMDFAGINVPMPPAAFVQATEEGEATMVNLVREGVGDASPIADLFSGIGTFTMPLAKNAQVLAVEGFKPALDACQMGVNTAQNLEQVLCKHRDLYRRPLTPKELAQFEAVVFDPPRAGAKEQVEQLKESDVPVVVSVSCSPNSFARDGRILIEGGYVLESVTPVGQFLWSPHIELVGVYKKSVS